MKIIKKFLLRSANSIEFNILFYVFDSLAKDAI